MKKFLLSLATAAVALSASAAPYEVASIEFKKENAEKGTSGYADVSCKYSLNKGKENVWQTNNFNNNNFNSGWTYIACGKKGYASVASITTQFAIAEGVTSVVVNYQAFTLPSKSEIRLEYAEALDATTWTNAATATTGNVGDYTFDVAGAPANCYWRLVYDLSSATGSNATIKINKVTVYGEAAGGVEKLPTELSFAEGSDITVGKLGEVANAPALVNPNNLAVTWSSSAPIVASVDANGVVTVNDWGEATITASYAGDDMFISGRASYKITAEPTAYNLADIVTLGTGNTSMIIKIGFPMTVTYVSSSKSNVYVKDAEGNHNLFFDDSKSNTYTAGDVLATGWAVNYSPYKGLPEFKLVGTTYPEVTTSANVEYPEATTIAEGDLNRPILLKNVTFAAATPDTNAAFTGVASDDTTLNFFNSQRLASVEAGKYDVLAVGAVNNDNFQVVPLEYTPAVEDTTGVSAIVAEGAAEYYNMQGVKVANPEKGLFIRVAGGKAAKVVK